MAKRKMPVTRKNARGTNSRGGMPNEGIPSKVTSRKRTGGYGSLKKRGR